MAGLKKKFCEKRHEKKKTKFLNWKQDCKNFAGRSPDK
jgi:hypothetical protein